MQAAIAVDLGGTNLRIAAITETGELLYRISLPTKSSESPSRVIRDMCDGIKELKDRASAEWKLAGIGIGVPGILYLEKGVLRESPNLPCWINYPVRDEIESILNMPVSLDNDANVAALGECWLGAGRGYESMCMLTLGTGIGGGLILHGKIWHGFLGMAGELGHIVVAEYGSRCPCGGQGCLETEASASAIARKGRKAYAQGHSSKLRQSATTAEEISSHLVYQCAKQGDAACQEIFQSAGRYLGIGIASLINALNLPLYVIGGGVAAAWDLLSPALFDEAQKRSYIYREGSTKIVPSQLGGDAGLYGAAKLPLQRLH